MNAVSSRQKGGLVIAGLLNLVNIPSVLSPTPDGEMGPPIAVLVLSSLVGVIGLLAVIVAWRGNRPALRVAAGTVIVTTLVALPAFFVDVPAWLKSMVALSVIAAVASVILMFSAKRRPAPVID